MYCFSPPPYSLIFTCYIQSKAEKKNTKNEKPAISPTLIGLLLFIICGSAVIGLVETLFRSYLSPSASNYEVANAINPEQQLAEQTYPMDDIAYEFEDPAVVESISADNLDIDNEIN